MRKKMHKVSVNGEEFSAQRGALLLDSALMNGVDIPHDCRSGHCGTCRVRVLQGRVLGGESGEPGAVRACQSRIISDVHLEIEDVPPIENTAGRVAELRPMAPDVVEVTIELARPISYLPGQYYQLQFRGFPVRCYSPTVPFHDVADDRSVRFHIRIVPDGRVSSALRRDIRVGHKIKLTGPFGSAYMRSNASNRLVLVSSGTGFAPIWAIADAAMEENPDREMVVIAGARTLDSLYMIPALCQLASQPNVTVVPVTSQPQDVTQAVRTGRPTDYLPPLSADDLVYTCGAPPMVAAVAELAAARGAACYADAFVPKGDDESPLLQRALSWLTGEVRVASAPTAPPASEPAAKPSWRSFGIGEPVEHAQARPPARRFEELPVEEPALDAQLRPILPIHPAHAFARAIPTNRPTRRKPSASLASLGH